MGFQVRGSRQVNGFLSVQKSSKFRIVLNLLSFSTLFTCRAFIIHSVFPSPFSHFLGQSIDHVPVGNDVCCVCFLYVQDQEQFYDCCSACLSSPCSFQSHLSSSVFKFRMSSRQWAHQCPFLLRFFIITPTDFSSVFYQLHTRKGKVMVLSQYRIVIVSPKSRS